MQSVNSYINADLTVRKSQGQGHTRQVNTTYVENDKFMFENQVACDITLTAFSVEGRTVTLPAHKYVLISRNPVFRAMFCSPLADKSDTVHVTDISSEALNELLRYLYYGDAHFDGDIVLELLYASSKYMIPSFASKCAEYLVENMDSDNACVILEYAMLYDEQDLIRKCLKYIQRYTAQILNSEGFLSLSRKTIQSIFSLDSLSVSEDTLVGALLRWAETRLNFKAEKGESDENVEVGSVFNGILDKIRVKSLTESKIQELLKSENDLEVKLAFLICTMKDRLFKNDEDSEVCTEANISIKPRLELPTGPVTCDVIATSSSSLVYNGSACAPLVVETSEPITIHKIHLLDRHYSNATGVIVTISQDDVTLINFEMPCNICRKSSDLGPIFSLTLPQAVQVEEGQFKIEVRYKISHGSYGSVQVGVPKSAQQEFGGLEFAFPNTSTSTPVASFEVSVA